MKTTKEVKLVKTNISVWLSTNHLLSKILTNFTSLVIFNYLPPSLSFWLSFFIMKIYACNNIFKVLKENECQEIMISKIFKRITNNHSLHKSRQLTQTTDIQEEEIIMSINLPYAEGTSEKLRRILRYQKIRSTFYTEKTLRKLHCQVNPNGL